jgi:leucyl aminopeptidase
MSYVPMNVDLIKKHVGLLVGGAVTFDKIGGLNIKTASGMLHMKCDMAGGATITESHHCRFTAARKSNCYSSMKIENSVSENHFYQVMLSQVTAVTPHNYRYHYGRLTVQTDFLTVKEL